MTSFKNNKGETIAETIIALMILAIGITFSGTLMANSLGNITSSKSRIIAVNIAREGVEAMRNIRDTNWLRFSGNRRDCWNHLPSTIPDTCDGSAPIEIGNFIIYKDENQRWRLRPYEVDDDFDNSRLFLVDVDIGRDTDGDSDLTNDKDMYNHQITADNTPIGAGDDPLGRLNSQETSFRRTLHIDYLNNDGDFVGDPALLGPEHNRMVITATVTWASGGREMVVELTTHLTDYLGRENFES